MNQHKPRRVIFLEHPRYIGEDAREIVEIIAWLEPRFRFTVGYTKLFNDQPILRAVIEV